MISGLTLVTVQGLLPAASPACNDPEVFQVTTIDMSQYLDVFLEESREHLSNLKRCLWHLEQEPGNQAALEQALEVCPYPEGNVLHHGFRGSG